MSVKIISKHMALCKQVDTEKPLYFAKFKKVFLYLQIFNNYDTITSDFKSKYMMVGYSFIYEKMLKIQY